MKKALTQKIFYPPIDPMFETDQTDVLADTNETAVTEEPTLAVTEEPTLADTTTEEPFLVEDVTDDEEEEESEGHTQRIGRELRSLGIVTEDQVTSEVRNLNTHYNPTFYVASTEHEICSAIISDPGEPRTLKEALNGPESEKWTTAELK
jgi:hypothetical protein